MVSTLWNPEKKDRAALNRGKQKLKLRRLRTDGLLREENCRYCEKPILIWVGHKPLSLTGHDHRCVGMPTKEIIK